MRNGSRLARHAAEQPDLPAFLFVPPRLGAPHDGLGGGEQPRAVGLQPVERARPHETLHLRPAELPRIDPVGEIGEIGERRLAACLDHGLHGGEPDPLHAGERVTDRQPPILHALDREIRRRLVDIRRQDRDTAVFRLLLQRRQPVGIVDRENSCTRR